MESIKLEKKHREAILKGIQHGDIASLHTLKAENPNFHWSSIFYDQTGDTALHIASRLGYLSIIDFLLKEFTPCAVNVRNKDDKTPLHEAAQFAQIEAILKLCSYGSEVNALRRGDWTPLMLACTKVQPKVSFNIVQALVQKGAEVNICNKDSWSCVHLLAREGGKDIFEYLVDRGLKVNIRTKNGRTALHIAALHGNKGILIKLLKYFDKDVKDGCGNTPLHEALLGQHIDIARLLVKEGANINARTNSDMSILHLVASQDALEPIDYVINELKLDVNCKNQNGWTAAHCAARKGLGQVVKHLKKKGADLLVEDNFGKTPLDYFALK